LGTFFKVIVIAGLAFFVWTRVLNQPTPDASAIIKLLPTAVVRDQPTSTPFKIKTDSKPPTKLTLTPNSNPAQSPNLPDCATVPTTQACQLSATPVVTPVIQAYNECYEGSFYTCEDLEKLRQQAREDVESDMHDAVVATDEFLIVPTTAPAVKQEWIDACAKTPVDKRDGFLKPICEGAGL